MNPAGSTDFDRPFLPGDSDLDVADWSAPFTQWGWEWGMGSDPDDFSKQYNYNYSLVPWAEAFEVQADFTAGDDAAGIDLIDRAWGTMLRLGPSTFYEASRDDGTPAYELGSQHDTVVHRWASGVGALLQQYVLGVEPTYSGVHVLADRTARRHLELGPRARAHSRGPLSAWWRWTGPSGARRGYTMVVVLRAGPKARWRCPFPNVGSSSSTAIECGAPLRTCSRRPMGRRRPASRHFRPRCRRPRDHMELDGADGGGETPPPSATPIPPWPAATGQ